MNLNKLLALSSELTSGFAFIVLIYTLATRKNWNLPIKTYWVFLLMSFLNNIIALLFIWSVNHYTSFFLPYLKCFHISDTNFLNILNELTNFIGLGFFFYYVLLKEKRSKWILWASLILSIAVVINYFFIQGYNMGGGFNSTASALYCVILPLIYMWIIFNQDSELPISKNPYFWVNLGLILPSTISLFLYFSGGIIHKFDFTLFVKLKITSNFIEIIAQFITAIGFYYTDKLKFIKV